MTERLTGFPNWHRCCMGGLSKVKSFYLGYTRIFLGGREGRKGRREGGGGKWGSAKGIFSKDQ